MSSTTVGQQIRSKNKYDWKDRIEKEILKPILDSFENNNKFIIDAISEDYTKKVMICEFSYDYKSKKPKDEPFEIDNSTNTSKTVSGSISEDDFLKFAPRYYYRGEGFFKGMLIEIRLRYPWSNLINYYAIYVLADKEYSAESCCIIC